MKPKFVAFAATRRFSLPRRSIWKITEQCPSSFYPTNSIFHEKKDKNRLSYVSHRHRSVLNYSNKSSQWNKLLKLLVTISRSLATLFFFALPNFPDYSKTHSGARRIKHWKSKDLSLLRLPAESFPQTCRKIRLTFTKPLERRHPWLP